MLDYARFDALLDEQLDALARRAEPSPSFAVGDDAEPHDSSPATEALWSLVEQALDEEDPDQAPLSFGDADDDDDDGGRLGGAWRECREFMQSALRSVSLAASVETGEGRTRMRTRVGWGGSAVSHVAADASPVDVAAHMAELQRAIALSTQRFRLVASISTAAARIATLIGTPIGTAKAVAIAYRCVRTVYERWRASEHEASPGEGTPWQ